MTPIRHSESDEPSPDLNNIIEALSDPSAFPGNVDEVIAIETHASAVFIAGDSVYKLKKPVNFGFLNYECASRRRLMCHLEVQVNQELAPAVYRGVVDLVTDDGEIRIGRAGRVIDHLVHMHRLPERATLASLMEQESAQIEDIDRIAMRIAGFHRRAYRSPEIDRWGLPAAVRRNVEENFEQVAPYLNRAIPPAAFDGIANYARNFLLERRGLLNARVRDGFTRDGHGDIRAEHVYVQDEVRIIDRIEFNDRIRYGDVAADVGFLAMDLDASNRPDLSDRLIETYQDRSDLDVDSVLDFYRCYRAYVRGKVTAFRLDQSPEERQQAISIEARRFFHLASRYASNDRRPRLIVMTGLTGSGKSTLARHLAAVLPAAVLDSDRTRKRLAGMDATSRQTVPFGSGIYSEELTERVYGELRDGACELLERGQTVILDATYTRSSHRRAALNLAVAVDARFLIVECEAPEPIIRDRLARRGDDPASVSDGRWEIYLSQKEASEQLSSRERDLAVQVDTNDGTLDQIEQVLGRLENWSGFGKDPA